MNKKNKKNFSRDQNQPGFLIDLLQKIQEEYSYLPTSILEEAANFYKISLTEIYSVATFYSQFKFNKPGQNQIKICHGTACHINKASKVSEQLENLLKIKPGETTPDGKFSLENVACLGCCSLAPVMMLNNKIYGYLDESKIKKILADF